MERYLRDTGRMKRTVLSAALPALFISLWVCLGGCTAVNVLELQDAETLGSGNDGYAIGAAYGPDIPNLYRDSTWKLTNALSIPFLYLRYERALGKTTDISLSAWSVSTPLLPFGFVAGHVETLDLGLQGGFRQMIYGADGDHKVTLGLAGLGYAGAWVLEEHAVFDSNTVAGEYMAAGIVPTLCYTWRREKGSIYGGVKGIWLFSREEFVRDFNFEKKIGELNDRRIFWAPYVGLAVDDDSRSRLHLEAAVVIAENPNTGRIEAMPFVGFARRFRF